MKRIAMMLCLILALGWISNAGMLSIRYDNGVGVKGIPLKPGYVAVFDFNGVKTSVSRTVVPLSTWFNRTDALVLVNGHWIQATPLGNGWLFQFKEIKTSVSGENLSGMR